MRYATVEELRSRWPEAPEDNDAHLERLLEDASMMIMVQYPAIPDEPGERLASTLSLIACTMVRRAANMAGFEGFSSYAETAGQFQQNFSLAGSGENLYLSAREQALIEMALYGPARSAGSFTAEA